MKDEQPLEDVENVQELKTTGAGQQGGAESAEAADRGNVPPDDAKPEWSTKKKVAVGIVAAALIAGLGIGCWYAYSASQSQPAAQEQPQKSGKEQERYALNIGAKAEGWEKGKSSPVIAHIVNEDEGVDYYHAYDANAGEALDTPTGDGYTISFISPVNADGSTYKAPEEQAIAAHVADGDDAGADTANDLPFTFEKIAAENLSAEEITTVAAQVTEAVKKGDETLAGENGVKVVELVGKNLKANENADKEAVSEQSEAASKTVESGGSQASTGNPGNTSKNNPASSNKGGGPSSNPSGGNSGSSSAGSGSSSSGGSSTGKPSHTHDWVAQTTTVHHDAQYTTVHHDAEYTTVHHDAVTKGVCICNGCGAQFDNDDAWGAHSESQILSGNMKCGSYHVTSMVVQQAYDEQVLVKDAWDEQVLVSAAWDETVTTGYKCSCGATK